VIRDEGKGIPEDKINDLSSGGSLSGVGIAGIRERTREMQGTFEIGSTASGATIRVSIPVMARSLQSLSVAG
jgi:signal transduction histidine kinase